MRTEALKMDRNCGKLIIKDGKVICPACEKATILHVWPNTTVRNLPRKCKRCGQVTIVNIEAPEPASTVTSA